MQGREGYLVPMDFSGSIGRIIKDPQEVAMFEMEQQSSWRRKLINRSLACPGTREMPAQRLLVFS